MPVVPPSTRPGTDVETGLKDGKAGNERCEVRVQKDDNEFVTCGEEVPTPEKEGRPWKRVCGRTR